MQAIDYHHYYRTPEKSARTDGENHAAPGIGCVIVVFVYDPMKYHVQGKSHERKPYLGNGNGDEHRNRAKSEPESPMPPEVEYAPLIDQYAVRLVHVAYFR